MHKYTVEFRIYSPDLDPSLVTTTLGLEPSLVRTTAELSQHPKFRHALWAYNGEESGRVREWQSLEEGFRFLLKMLSPVKGRLVAFQKHNFVFWCGHFQSSFDGGPTLSPELLRELADFGVPVFIDNYFEQRNQEHE
jgi:hypothetical protein